jgi:hypothetical protein
MIVAQFDIQKIFATKVSCMDFVDHCFRDQEIALSGVEDAVVNRVIAAC